jgi:hypothetical protein
MVHLTADRPHAVDRFLSRAVALVAIVTMPAGLFGYYQHQHERRVETTLDLYRSFKNGEPQKNWSFLATLWTQQSQVVENALKEKDKDTALLNITSDIIDQKAGAPALAQVLSFFEEVSTCVENSLCDYNAAHALFHNLAHECTGYFGSYILDKRNRPGYQHYADGLIKVNKMIKRPSLFDWS